MSKYDFSRFSLDHYHFDLSGRPLESAESKVVAIAGGIAIVFLSLIMLPVLYSGLALHSVILVVMGGLFPGILHYVLFRGFGSGRTAIIFTAIIALSYLLAFLHFGFLALLALVGGVTFGVWRRGEFALPFLTVTKRYPF